MEDHLSQPHTLFDVESLCTKVVGADKQFSSIPIVNNTLIHQQVVFPQAGGSAYYPGEQVGRHVNLHVGMYINGLTGSNIAVLANI